ncbi:LysM peptidoglycan-binding domain-containing protein [Chloroflexota bacterium]
MKSWQQALLAVFMALLSGLIILGSLSLSLAESGFQLALLATSTPTLWQPILVSAEPGLSFVTGTAAFTPTITMTFTPDADCPAPPGWIAVPVGLDESLETIATRYGITKDELKQKNCLLVDSIKPSFLYVPEPTPANETAPTLTPGCVVSAPASWVLYKVKTGDTFYSLASNYGITSAELMQANCYSDPRDLKAGLTIWVPWIPVPTHTLAPFYTYTPVPTNTWLPIGTSTVMITTSTPTGTATAGPTSTQTSTQTPTATYTPTPTTTGVLVTHTDTSLPPTSTNTPVQSDTPTPTGTTVPPGTSTNTPVPTVTPYPLSSLE